MATMKMTQLKASRQAAGLTQTQLAQKLGKTQAYVSLMERGLRSPSMPLAKRLAKVLKLPPTAYPFRLSKQGLVRSDTDWVAKGLASLGYPGFAYLGSSHSSINPTEVLLRTLAAQPVDARLVEAMPWLLLHFDGFDREKTVMLAHNRSLQNRLGFVVTLAKGVAKSNTEFAHRLPELDELLSSLEPLRLAREEDLGQQLKSEQFRAWVRDTRTEDAAHWNLLTDLGTRCLAYVD